MDKDLCQTGSAICASSSPKPAITWLNVEKIENGYLIFPNNNYCVNYKRVFVTELSEVPAVLANMFGMHDDILNS